MAVININLACELQQPVKVQYLDGVVFTQDNQANKINVSVFDNGAAASISGSVTADIVRADGATIAATGGSISGNVASITLPAAAYVVPGVLSVAVKITKNSVVTTIAAFVTNVYASSTDTVVDPGTIIPSVQTLIAAIEAAVASIPADYSSLWTSLAPSFSSSNSYTAGQYVTYDGGLYLFVANHSGSWTAADVVAVNVGGELKKLNGAVAKMPNTYVHIFNNYYLRSNDEFLALTNYHVGIADAGEGDIFVVSGCGYSSSYYAWNFLDEDLDIISHDTSHSSYTFIQNQIVIAPANAKYIAVNIGENNSVSDLVCRKVMTDADYAFLSGENSYLLADCGVIHDNTFYDLRINALTVNSTMRMIMTECQAGDIFQLSGTSYNSNYAAYVFMDSESNIIDKAENFITGQVTIYEDYFVKAPEDAAYIYVSGSKEILGDDKVYMKKLFSKDTPHSEFLMYNSVLAGGERKKNTYFNSSGQYSSLTGYDCYEIPCQEDDVFLVSCRGYSLTYYAWSFLNSSGQIIDHSGSRYQINVSFRNNYITAPENAVKLVLNSGESDDHLKCIQNGGMTILDLDTQSEESTWFKGKKIVWFGTSIPAGKVNGVSYPEIVAAKLGATVYNEALGSSPMSSGVPVNASRLRALSLTYAEKQAQSWWSELTADEKTIAMNSSYDYKVTKYLTGGSVGPVDLYVFDHGYNDYYYPDPTRYMEEPSNPNDKSYALGAANFLINAILQDNPRARIVWIGHYENALNDPTDHQSWGKPVAELQEYISEKYGIPLCRTWENTGWSNPHKITTTGYWSNGYWQNSGGTSRQDYVKNCAFADGIHPNTDLSGESTNKMADIITGWLKGVYD